MQRTVRLKIKPYIQPFERELAFREVAALTGFSPEPALIEGEHSHEFTVKTEQRASALAQRLAYWESVIDAQGGHHTTQSLRESTVNVVRNGIALDSLREKLPFAAEVPLPNRRCLRYGTHGIHEYRGKFFPQLVRALINISGTVPGGVVADPMSGSGTTVVEALLAGCKGRGLDMNPLSTLLGNTKAKLLHADAEVMAACYVQLRDELLALEARTTNSSRFFCSLPVEDQEYLKAWFSDDVLAGLDDISSAIQRLPDEHAKSLSRVALSNIIRGVSWQKKEDLRVRKEIRLDIEIDPKKEFLEEIGRSIRAVLAFLYQNGPLESSEYEISDGDARRCGDIWGENSVDTVITSPPYATALPYLDTDRLSLCYLGLLPRPEHRRRDQSMIGNREVTEGVRKGYWERYIESKGLLPASVTSLIDEINVLNSNGTAGFRRRNLPALLSKYFFDMREVLSGVKKALKPGCSAFVVVGNNHTIAGGRRIDIQTAKLLEDIAYSLGFEVGTSLSMEMLVSRDIFKGNAMASEEILVFRKPGH